MPDFDGYAIAFRHEIRGGRLFISDFTIKEEAVFSQGTASARVDFAQFLAETPHRDMVVLQPDKSLELCLFALGFRYDGDDGDMGYAPNAPYPRPNFRKSLPGCFSLQSPVLRVGGELTSVGDLDVGDIMLDGGMVTALFEIEISHLYTNGECQVGILNAAPLVDGSWARVPDHPDFTTVKVARPVPCRLICTTSFRVHTPLHLFTDMWETEKMRDLAIEKARDVPHLLNTRSVIDQPDLS